MKKAFVAIMTCILLFFVNIAYANTFNVVVESMSADAGETVDVNITLENNSGLLAAKFSVEYDQTRLELMGCKDGGILKGAMFSQSFSKYPYVMLWNSASTSDFDEDGILVTLKFKVLDNAKTGKALVKLTYNENDVFDVDLNNVYINVINGNIDVNGINDDAEIDTPSLTPSDKNENKDETETENGDKENTAPSKPSKNTSSYIPAGTVISSPTISKNNQIILTIGKLDALVFGKTVSNDVAPLIRSDRTMLPARFVAENLGANVEWNGSDRTVIITKDDIKIVITIDSQYATVNNKSVFLDSPAFIENDRTYTPLRFIAENLGATVEWNDKTREVIISKK